MCFVVTRWLESILGSIDIRMSKVVGDGNKGGIHDTMQLLEDVTMAYSIYSRDLSMWNARLSEEFTCRLLCLLRKTLIRVHNVDPRCFRTTLPTIR